MAARGGGTGINPNQDAQGLFICICLRVARGANPNPSHRVSGLGTERLRHLSSYTIGRVWIWHVMNIPFLFVLVCLLSHDLVLFCLTFELLVN